MRISGLLMVFLLLPWTARTQVIFNEIMASNATTLMEEDYFNFADWIEVYNSGTSSVNLSDYNLSDDHNIFQKWQFPAYTLAAGQYFLIYCDKEGTGMHTTFGLRADGKALYLCNKTGQVKEILR
jgi:hypothetical protein